MSIFFVQLDKFDKINNSWIRDLFKVSHKRFSHTFRNTIQGAQIWEYKVDQDDDIANFVCR